MLEETNDVVEQLDQKKLNLIFEKIMKLEKENSKTNSKRDSEMIDSIKAIIKEEVDKKC